MKKVYTPLKMEIVNFSVENIITTSGFDTANTAPIIGENRNNNN